MKISSTCPLAALMGALAFGAQAFTVDETNNVALAILSYASMDNEDDLDVDAEYPVRYSDWKGLLDCVAIPGWGRQDKDEALFGYMMRMSTNDFGKVDGEICELMRIGLCEYRDLNCTNAIPIVRNWAINPTAKFRDEAIYIYYNWIDLNQDFLTTTGVLLTNALLSAGQARMEACRGAAVAMGRHKRRFGADSCFTNALHMVYRSRSGNAECAMPLDNLFVAEIPGYEWSSNRLETVRSWLDGSANCPAEVMQHCISITNRLLNASHPLAWIEVLRNL